MAMNIIPSKPPGTVTPETTIDAAWPQPSSEILARKWPRCEPASTHFELGASEDYRPTAILSQRCTPKSLLPK